jgi:hypothetical protein
MSPLGSVLTYLAGVSPSTDSGTGFGANIRFNINGAPSSNATAGLTPFLLTSQGLTPGRYNSNLSIDNLKVGGQWDRSAVASAKAGRIAVVGNGALLGSMKLSNFTFEDLVVKENAGDPAALGITWQANNLATDVHFRRVSGMTAASWVVRPIDALMRFVWEDCGTSTAPSPGAYVVTPGAAAWRG